MRIFRIIILPMLVLMTILLPAAVSSQSTTKSLQQTCDGAAAKTEYCKNLKSGDGNRKILGKDGVLTKVAQFIVFLTGAVSVIMVIIGGLRYVLSGGDSNATKGAKDTVMYAVIGLVVAIFSQIIVTFVLSRL